MDSIPNYEPGGLEASARRRELRIQLCRAVSRLADRDPAANNAAQIAHVALALAALLDHCRGMARHGHERKGRQ